MKDENLHWLPFLLQTADALFPTGAYAHSLGFEEIVRLGLVRDERSLGEFLHRQIIPAQRQHELPYLRFACEAARDGHLAELRRLDLEISAWKLAAETRSASAQLGTRRLKALRTIGDAPLLGAFDTLIARGTCAGHHLVVCGLQASVEGVPLEAALAAYFYQSLAALGAAALKLIRIGQDGVQRVLRAASMEANSVTPASLLVSRAHAGWFNPLLEIASMRHERAFERLFIS
ncbi:Urease accessory protein UreF [Chthoniobacter flavus Ellin428]|uniref:Urease accessory protein UreF n=1 Tax=Chthoniobacter flavus Ellin428 TaxID=497964 RepID=B4D6T4_9BACT|nr:urease accessory UreF family protein [Chthoniobacter flavus]EDY17885.1 Urease accessory protein UreF [Chthoniobacter flavus Ellin428]TCO88495.1 urease accessory protein [Chthoniobacter flavus]